MVFLKVIPASLLFIHGSAGHCNLETCTCMCVCAGARPRMRMYACARAEFHKRARGGTRCAREKWREREKKRRGGGRPGRGCGREYGFGFPSLRGERKSIDSEAESEADRVAAQGCAGTQREHDPRHQQGRHLTPHRVGKEVGRQKTVGGRC